MASTQTINKGTEEAKGNGLPFVERKEDLVSNTHPLKPVLVGFLTPASVLPSFQIWIEAPTTCSFVSAHYEHPSIDNNTIIPLTLPVAIPSEEVTVNGTKNCIYSSHKIPVQGTPPTCGMYTLVLTFLVGGSERRYYSHEVSVFNG